MSQAEKGRRDHYVPQGYLRGFIHPSRDPSSGPLWVYQVTRRRWVQRSPKSVGWATGFYDDPVGSNPDGSADDVFRAHENAFPAARDAIRRQGYTTWGSHRDVLIGFAAMLSARSPLFLGQAANQVAPPSASDPEKEVLARSRGITTMRAEVPDRGDRWIRGLHWILRYVLDPASPVVASDQNVGMDGVAPDIAEAAADPRTTWFFPVAWDMYLLGSVARLEPACAESCDNDIRRLRSLVMAQAQRFVVSPVRLQPTDFQREPPKPTLTP